MGGTSNCTGRVEVKHQREWRPVYHYDWNHQSSSVVCRQLGCGSVVSTEQRHGSTDPTWYAFFGGSTERRRSSTDVPTWRIRDKCVGTESSLKECGVMGSSSYSFSLYLICSGNKQ